MSAAQLRFFKERSLPSNLVPNSVYFIGDPSHPQSLEIYVTGTDANVVRQTLSEKDVKGLISAAILEAQLGSTPAEGSKLLLVDTIAERDALALNENSLVLVKDATSDSTVKMGAASYIYDAANAVFIKIAEYESLDLQITWANIAGKPTSTAAQIDAAVAKSHSHANSTVLDKISEDTNGRLLYNGAIVGNVLDTAAW
jgi:hypothetical protein